MAARRSQVLSRRFIFLSCCVKESEMKKKEKIIIQMLGVIMTRGRQFFLRQNQLDSR